MAFIPINLHPDTKSLLSASLSSSAWNKNASALNCFRDFDSQSSNSHKWPLSEKSISDFITWAVISRKLKSSTVKSYLCAINMAHKYAGLDGSSCSSFLASALLKGAENLEFYRDLTSNARKAMSLPLLKLIGHQIAISDWSDDTKIVIWCACVTAFFGSFRLGEILGKNEKSFNQAETLLWRDIKIRGDSILINIKIPKSRNAKGEFVDLFEFKMNNCCPVETMKKLKLSKGKLGNEASPVFCFDNGRILTPKTLTATVQSLLEPVIGDSAKLISGHSFRAGIPSVLSNNPELAKDEDIKLWGRWGSPSFKKYTRLHMKKRKAIFVKITSVLNKR